MHDIALQDITLSSYLDNDFTTVMGTINQYQYKILDSDMYHFPVFVLGHFLMRRLYLRPRVHL